MTCETHGIIVPAEDGRADDGHSRPRRRRRRSTSKSRHVVVMVMAFFLLHLFYRYIMHSRSETPRGDAIPGRETINILPPKEMGVEIMSACSFLRQTGNSTAIPPPMRDGASAFWLFKKHYRFHWEKIFPLKYGLHGPRTVFTAGRQPSCAILIHLSSIRLRTYLHRKKVDSSAPLSLTLSLGKEI